MKSIGNLLYKTVPPLRTLPKSADPTLHHPAKQKMILPNAAYMSSILEASLPQALHPAAMLLGPLSRAISAQAISAGSPST